MSQKNQKYGNGVLYEGARAMKTYKDDNGNVWLCDKAIDPTGDFAAQGCWRVDQMPFDRND